MKAALLALTFVLSGCGAASARSTIAPSPIQPLMRVQLEQVTVTGDQLQGSVAVFSDMIGTVGIAEYNKGNRLLIVVCAAMTAYHLRTGLHQPIGGFAMAGYDHAAAVIVWPRAADRPSYNCNSATLGG